MALTSCVEFQLWLDYPIAWRPFALPFYNTLNRLGVVPALFLGWLFIIGIFIWQLRTSDMADCRYFFNTHGSGIYGFCSLIPSL